MSDADPALAFFPDGDVDLYAVLKVSSTASADEIKSAYRRQALLFHPDKVSATLKGKPDELEKATLKFQQVGFAYEVLKEDARRKTYDLTGSTAEIVSGKTEAEWKDYFRELWSGEVNAQTIDEFKRKYQGSEEEKKDVLEAYETVKGDLDEITNHVMCSTLDDEDRFVDIITQAISDGTLVETKKWKASMKELDKGKKRRKAKADKEAKEAEQLAKELGVHDKLFSKGASSSKGGKSKKAEGGDGDEAALAALIRGNQAKRMEGMLESIEAKYGASAKENRKKRKSDEGAAPSRSGSKKAKTTAEPSEEEFAAIQARLDARRGKK